MRRGFIILMILGFGITHSIPAEGLSESRTTVCWKMLVKVATVKIPRRIYLPLLGGLVLFPAGTGFVYLSYHHDVAAVFGDEEHIGYGIYLDKDGILATFSEDEKELLKNPLENAETVIRFLTEKLSGDEDLSMLRNEDGGTEESRHWYSHDYFRGIKASRFFIHDGQPRGVCRHKAKILAAVLNWLEIPARYEEAMVDGESPFSSHAFVYVPHLDLVADPMNNVVWPRAKYQQVFLDPPSKSTRK